MADSLVFAFTVPTPEREAIIVYDNVSWPITTEAQAYKLAKMVGALGFWRIKCEHNWIEATHLNSRKPEHICAACGAEARGRVNL